MIRSTIRPLDACERGFLEGKVKALGRPSVGECLRIVRRIAVIFLLAGMLPAIAIAYIGAVLGRSLPHLPPEWRDFASFGFAYALLVFVVSALSIKDKFNERRAQRSPFEEVLKEETVEEIRIQATSAIALPGVGDLMDFDDSPQSYEFPMQDCHKQAFLLQTTDQQLIVVRLRQPFLFWEEGSTAELASVWPNSDMTLVISRASRLPIRGLFLGERLVPMVWTRMECKLWPSREPRDAVYVGNAMPGSIDQLEEYFRTAGFERLFRVGEDGR